MKRLVYAVMLLAALAAASLGYADTKQRGVKYSGKDASPVGGYAADSTFYPLKTDWQGRAQVVIGGYTGDSIFYYGSINASDRSLNVKVGNLLSPVTEQPTGVCLASTATLAAGQLFRCPTMIDMRDNKSATLLVSWSPADSDSVCLSIYAVGKVTPVDGDGYDFAFDACTQDSVAWTGYTVTSLESNATLRTYYTPQEQTLTLSASVVIGVTGAPSPTAYPGLAVQYGGVKTYMAAVPIMSYPAGMRPDFPYLTFWVLNRSSQALNGLCISAITRGL